MTLRVGVFTGSRADYGPLWPLLNALQVDDAVELQLMVGGAHLRKEFGETVSQILADGFSPQLTIDSFGSTSDRDAARIVGVTVMELAAKLPVLAPDLVVVLGDRYELLGVLAACVCLGIPLVHVAGGHVTRGAAVDEQVRHAATKAAHLHCVPTPVHARRVAQMGEEPWRICVSGSLGLDSIVNVELPPFPAVAAELGIDPNAPTALVTLHPTTLELDSTEWHVDNLVTALDQAGLQYVITYPNADPEHHRIRMGLEAFVQRYRGRAVLVENLGQRRYLAVMKSAVAMIGNSSSGVIEAPAFDTPVVNVGRRQEGRLFASNIFQCDHDTESILSAIRLALGYDRPGCVNLYGDGHAAKRIVKFIKKVYATKTKTQILEKRFVDLKGE